MKADTEIEKIIQAKINECLKNPGRRRPRGWIKIDCDGWLHGSINYRMTPAQIAVFSKMMVMAEKFGPVPGLISDNDFRPLPYSYLAHQACCEEELFKETLELAKQDGSVYENSHGIFLPNFDTYQFTEYDRQKPYREAKKQKELDPDKYIKGKYGQMVRRK